MRSIIVRLKSLFVFNIPPFVRDNNKSCAKTCNKNSQYEKIEWGKKTSKCPPFLYVNNTLLPRVYISVGGHSVGYTCDAEVNSVPVEHSVYRTS